MSVIQMVRPTTCPQWTELREKFSVVVLSITPGDPGSILQAGFPSGIGEVGYVGRAVNGEDMMLEDAFMYQSVAALMGGAGGGVNARFAVAFYPPVSFGVDRLVLSPSSWRAMYRLSDVPSVCSKAFRDSLVKAWDMREEMRKRSPEIEIASR